MKLSSPLLLVLCLAQLTACSTAQKNRELVTVVGFAVGAALGSATAPSDEKPELHAMYWAGLVGTGSALVANQVFNDETEKETMRIEIAKLKSDLDNIQNSKAILIKSGTGHPSGTTALGDKKVRWKMYEIDKWVPTDDNKVIHQNLIIEVEK